jgi:hypothetical protein
MCPVCAEFGGLGRSSCPVCRREEPEEPEAPVFHCQWCGRDFAEADNEAVSYKNSFYCRECYMGEKEEDEALAGDIIKTVNFNK